MSQPGPLVRLSLETQDEHAVAEELWQTLCDDERTQCEDDYLRVLVRTYGFEAPLEAALAYTPNLGLFVDARDRSKAGLIAQDLLVLGVRAAELSALPQCSVTPFHGPLEALGWLYVTERFTLLHDRVRRHVVRQPELARATAYLTAYGGHVGTRWTELGRAMDRAARTERMLDEIVASAHAGFAQWIDWCRRDTAARRRA